MADYGKREGVSSGSQSDAIPAALSVRSKEHQSGETLTDSLTSPSRFTPAARVVPCSFLVIRKTVSRK